MQDQAFNKLRKEHRDGLKRDPSSVAVIFKGTDFEKRGTATTKKVDESSPFSENNPFCTPPRTPAQETERVSSSLAVSKYSTTSYRGQANEAFTAAGIKAPCKSRRQNTTESLLQHAKELTLTDVAK